MVMLQTGSAVVARMPHSIQRLVSDSNVHFAHQCDIFNANYFGFLSNLIDQSSASVNSSVIALPAALNFFHNIYLRTKKVYNFYSLDSAGFQLCILGNPGANAVCAVSTGEDYSPLPGRPIPRS